MLEETVKVEETRGLPQRSVRKSLNKVTVIQHIRFFLIPGWRDSEFTAREYEIEKIKSKRRLFRRLLTPLTIGGLCLIIFIVFLAIYAPWLTPYTLEGVTDGGISGINPWLLPSEQHPFGTTAFGYDVFGRIIWGARTAIVFGFIAIAIATGGGIVVGTIAGYYGGWVDSILMRIVDFVIVFPASVIVILLVQLSDEQSLLTILMIYGAFAITGYSRLMRASVLQVKQEVYIEAARTGGAKNFKIMFKHVFANAISPIIIRFFGGVGLAILAFSGIAFLGFGDQQLPDWGTDINYARARLSAIHAAIWPGLFILIAVLGFMLVGDGLRDALDPRLQQKI
ncbi:MAG: ABC transporter permease [Promethearchaeota archaeon]|jgi:ABC-type dipeptide/oligopeptide/nickel transport system permease subunit